jgi:hypothetical protein
VQSGIFAGLGEVMIDGSKCAFFVFALAIVVVGADIVHCDGRGGCDCDCSWANPTSCQNDDGCVQDFCWAMRVCALRMAVDGLRWLSSLQVVLLRLLLRIVAKPQPRSRCVSRRGRWLMNACPLMPALHPG